MPVERALIAPPRCRMGAITAEERAAVRARSPVGTKYDTAVESRIGVRDPEQARRPIGDAGSARPAVREPRPRRASRRRTEPESRERPQPAPTRLERVGGASNDCLWGTKRRQGMVETMAKQAARTVGSQVGRQILRGVLGGILGGSRRR